MLYSYPNHKNTLNPFFYCIIININQPSSSFNLYIIYKTDTSINVSQNYKQLYIKIY